MPVYTYVTAKCKEEATRHGLLEDVKKLAADVEKKQSYGNFENYLPSPYLIKKMGNRFRLICHEHELSEVNKVLSFVLFNARDDDPYKHFLNNNYKLDSSRIPSKEEIRLYLDQREPEEVSEMEDPSPNEYVMLYDNDFSEFDDTFIYESEQWIASIDGTSSIIERNRVMIYNKLRDFDFENHDNACSIIAVNDQITLRCVTKWQHNVIFLEGVYLDGKDRIPALSDEYAGLVTANTREETLEIVRKASRKAYPYIILADEDFWFQIEENREGNFALSPEEANLIELIQKESNDQRYPLFINGRPGSGKSTILQYLYTFKLMKYHSLENPAFLPPLYLTYSDKLLTRAMESVKNIASCSYHFVDRDVAIDASNLDNCFFTYSDLLLSLLPLPDKPRFDRNNRVDFYTFKTEWVKKHHASLTAEIVWHVVRTYIKGMVTDYGDYLDPEAYQELPNKQKTVTHDLYEKVWREAWDSWYRDYSNGVDHWDDQDLTRFVLSHEDIEFPDYPCVFCDESQDFTRIEIALISRLNLFTRRSLNNTASTRIPFAFAGDPFQTVNPTGFDWDAVKVTFSEKLSTEICKYSNKRIKINLQDLSYNYRSNRDIVGLCNLIQLLRGIIFDKPNLLPQQSWFSDKYGVGNYYFDVDSSTFTEKFRKNSDVVVIIPCQEGEEESYLANDPLLSEIGKEFPQLPLNVLSVLAAKGLEFSLVVLYKFGDLCLKEYPRVLKILENPGPELNLDESLPMEYYFNRLFVAASRARKRCVIADTREAIESFWQNKTIGDFDNLISRYGDPQWTADNLCFVDIGTEDTKWSDDRDNPLEVAKIMKESGMAAQNPYIMKLAASNFKRVNEEHEYLECTALQHEYANEYQKAAEVYLTLKQDAKAMSLYWKAEDFAAVCRLNLTNTGKYSAAHFYLNKTESEEQLKILDFLYANHESIREFHIDPVWRKVIRVMVDALVSNTTTTTEQNMHIFVKTEQLYSSNLFSDSKAMGTICFKATRYQDALTYWESSQDKNIAFTESYYLAKAHTVEYPENIVWYAKAKRYGQIVELVKASSMESLSSEEALLAFEAFMGEKKIADLMKLISKYSTVAILDKTLLNEDYAKVIGPKRYLKIALSSFSVYDENSQWEKLVRVVTILQKKNLLEKKHIYDLIRLMAGSRTIMEAETGTKQLNDVIKKYIYDKNKYNIPIDFRITGMALEKNNVMIDVLSFYERIWRQATSVSSPETFHARQRWIKVKQKYIDYLINQDKPFGKHEDELNRYSREWRMDPKKLPELPILEQPEDKQPEQEIDPSKLNKGEHLPILEDSDTAAIAKKLNISEELVLKIKKELGR